jgi:hypothetical protein
MGTATRELQRWLGPVLLLAALPVLMGTECEEPLVADSGFDVWCGDTLCNWHVDMGAIAKVPTWHERDYGVELVGPSVQISQSLAFTSDDVTCLHFNLLADVDDAANVILELDYDSDGVPDQMQAISAGRWTPIKYRLPTPTYFHGVTISIRKGGPGHAALAQIQASKASDCAGAGSPPVTLNRPSAAACESAAECTSGTCLPGGPLSVCAADGRNCTSDADCAAASPASTDGSVDAIASPDASADNSCTYLGVTGGRCQ